MGGRGIRLLRGARAGAAYSGRAAARNGVPCPGPSGSPPVAVRCVYQVYAAMRVGSVREVPTLGMDGIASGRDAFEFALAVNSAIAVGTTIFNDASAPPRVLAELEFVLAEAGFTSWRQAIGRVRGA
ncbi:hypothetical protein [Streptomyces sp. HUAS TT7]|uniref:hypothetical protein n=1 Tax=Streptomyces sp. HUAS TT7 TaxID=3447507 RepID=UPI003F65FAF6